MFARLALFQFFLLFRIDLIKHIIFSEASFSRCFLFIDFRYKYFPFENYPVFNFLPIRTALVLFFPSSTLSFLRCPLRSFQLFPFQMYQCSDFIFRIVIFQIAFWEVSFFRLFLWELSFFVFPFQRCPFSELSFFGTISFLGGFLFELIPFMLWFVSVFVNFQNVPFPMFPFQSCPFSDWSLSDVSFFRFVLFRIVSVQCCSLFRIVLFSLLSFQNCHVSVCSY